MPLHAPSLCTTRLALRELNEDDAPFVLRLLRDPGWVEHIGDRGVLDLAGAKDYIADGPRRSYRENGFGLMRIALRQTDTPIGICGLVIRESLPGPDLGFTLLTEYAGQGYASEASRIVIQDAFDRVKLDQLLAITSPKNSASRRLLEKAGFVEVEEQPESAEPDSSVVYRLNAADRPDATARIGTSA